MYFSDYGQSSYSNHCTFWYSRATAAKAHWEFGWRDGELYMKSHERKNLCVVWEVWKRHDGSFAEVVRMGTKWSAQWNDWARSGDLSIHIVRAGYESERNGLTDMYRLPKTPVGMWLRGDNRSRQKLKQTLRTLIPRVVEDVDNLKNHPAELQETSYAKCEGRIRSFVGTRCMWRETEIVTSVQLSAWSLLSAVLWFVIPGGSGWTDGWCCSGHWGQGGI